MERLRKAIQCLGGSTPTRLKRRGQDVPQQTLSRLEDSLRYVLGVYERENLDQLPWREFQRKFQSISQRYTQQLTDLRKNQPVVKREDIEAYLEHLEPGRYEVSYGKYHDPETSYRDAKQIVMQINRSAHLDELVAKYEEFEEFLDVIYKGSHYSKHPVREKTVGWIRLDKVSNDLLLVDEIQGDVFTAFDQAKTILTHETYEEFVESIENVKVREQVLEKVEPWRFGATKAEFERRGLTIEELDKMKRYALSLFADWAEEGMATLLQWARSKGIDRVAIHTEETLRQRDPTLDANKVTIYYKNLAKSYGFKEETLTIGDRTGRFLVRQACRQ